MAKRNRRFDEKVYEKWLREGRGSGQGKDYKPWIRIQDVPSLGRVTRVRGIKTRRQHDFLSDMELNYFYMIEYSDNVIDIKEQYPLLMLEETLAIAEELGITHPQDPFTKYPIVMTTDFFITIKDSNGIRNVARTIKSKDDLMNERQCEKFEIERRYWKIKNVHWGIVTEEEIDKNVAKTIENCYKFYELKKLEIFQGIASREINKLINYFKNVLVGNEVTVREICSAFDERFNLKLGSGVSIYKHLIITKQIEVDLKKAMNIDLPSIINAKALNMEETI